MVSAEYPAFKARDSPSLLWWPVRGRIWKRMSQIEIIIMPVNHHQPPDEHQWFLNFGIPRCFSATPPSEFFLNKLCLSVWDQMQTSNIPLIALCVWPNQYHHIKLLHRQRTSQYLRGSMVVKFDLALYFSASDSGIQNGVLLYLFKVEIVFPPSVYSSF